MAYTIHNDSNGNYYVVVAKGNTLSGIAADAGVQAASGNKTYKQLAALNNISNANLIYIGQKIYVAKSGSGSTSNSSSAPTNKAVVTHFGVQSNTDNTLFATWTWSKSKNNTDHYETWWDYDTGDGVWFIGNKGSVTAETNQEMQSTYGIPSNAKRVRFFVKPISKTYKQGDKDVSYWTAEWSNAKTWTDTTPLVTPATPAVKIENLTLTATLDGIDINGATYISFQVVKDNEKVFRNGDAKISTGHASFSCTVDAGSEYKVRCYAYSKKKDGYWSDWSEYSDNYPTIPAPVSSITSIQATSETSVKLEWSSVKTAETYEVEYATKKEYFDGSDQTTTKTGIEFAHVEMSGLATGSEYFFRVRATNPQGSSAWTEPKSIVLGTDPAAPTTWSSATTAIVGEEVVLYWVHNSEDGSSQTYAELELKIGDTVDHEHDPIIHDSDGSSTITIKNSTDDDLKDKTSSCVIDTTTGTLKWTEDSGSKELLLGVDFKEGVRIAWRVKTAGVTNKFGEWSIERTIDVYAQPNLELTMSRSESHLVTESEGVYTKTDTVLGFITGDIVDSATTTTNDQVYRGIDTDGQIIYYCQELVDVEIDEELRIPKITSFPFYISGIPGPRTQAPIGYHLSVIANEQYETTDNLGNVKMVSAGELVYSKYFDIKYELLVELSAGNIDLHNNIEYTVTCTAAMNSGLTAEKSIDFVVYWDEIGCAPNAEVGLDMETLTASIQPYCTDYKRVYRRVEQNGRSYMMTDEILEYVYGDPVKNAFVESGAQVYRGVSVDSDDELLFCEDDTVTPIADVYFSVYRREFDGGFTELATMLDGENNTAITDPHPALDMARYRVVAISKSTGAVSYYDLPGIPVNGNAVIIQWDEAWSSFESTEEAALTEPAWSGSMLKLPYNIDVSDSTSPEVELIEYVGRKHPVSYYGTQRGHKSSWAVVIDKDDEETLYGLRRLAMWMGDVYVREPSGSGYWAHIKVSFNQKHSDLTIPVSLDIIRVEGGA